MRNIYFVLLICFLGGCGAGPNEATLSEITSKIRNTFGTENCSLNFSDFVDSSGEVNHKVTIMLDGLGEKSVNEERWKIASKVTMILYNTLDQSEIDKYKTVEVKINVGDEHFQTTFSKSAIEKILRLTKTIDKFFDMERKKDFSTSQQIFDMNIVSDSAILTIKKAFAVIDSAGGELKSFAVTYFAQSKLKTGEPITGIWVYAINGNEFTNYEFNFLDKSGKITYVGFNESSE